MEDSTDLNTGVIVPARHLTALPPPPLTSFLRFLPTPSSPPPPSVATLSDGIHSFLFSKWKKGKFSPFILNGSLLQGHTPSFPLYNPVSY